MPELPEVETVRRGLLKQLPGEKIKTVEVLRSDSVGYPGADEFASSLPGHKFGDIDRRGKYIIFHLDRGALLVAHLRMSGRLLMDPKKVACREHVRIRLHMHSGKQLVFEDMRVFGRLWYVPAGESLEAICAGLAELGVEPLEGLTGKHMQKSFERRTQAIKTALLDQTVIAGIGNIYADESLHRAGIHPTRSACDLTLSEFNRLSKHIKDVLAIAIEARGSSLRNYTDSDGVNGNYQGRSLVYGRAGEPCRKCKTPIKRLKLAGRSAHFCPKCQPLK